MIDAIVADANPLLSALLGGRARDVLFTEELTIYSAQHTLFEVEKYLSRVAEKIGQSELTLFRIFQLLPVTAIQPRMYDSQIERATQLIGHRDPKDVHEAAAGVAQSFGRRGRRCQRGVTAGPSPEDIAALNETFAELLGQLTGHQREIALLKMQAYSHREISERAGCSIATVERRLRQNTGNVASAR